MKVSLNLYSTDSTGKKKSKAISDVSSSATNAEILDFTQKLNALTTNTYSSTVKVTTEIVDDATDKTIPTLELSATSKKGSEIQPEGALATITYNGDAVPYAVPDKLDSGLTIFVFKPQDDILLYSMSASESVDTSKFPLVITVRADETDTFAAAEATFTITAD